jgi:hypothetical protein
MSGRRSTFSLKENEEDEKKNDSFLIRLLGRKI